jgi:hypothetical protein
MAVHNEIALQPEIGRNPFLLARIAKEVERGALGRSTKSATLTPQNFGCARVALSAGLFLALQRYLIYLLPPQTLPENS